MVKHAAMYQRIKHAPYGTIALLLTLLLAQPAWAAPSPSGALAAQLSAADAIPATALGKIKHMPRAHEQAEEPFELCKKHLTPLLPTDILANYVGQRIRLTTTAGLVFWGTLHEPYLRLSSHQFWTVDLDEGRPVGVRTYPYEQIHAISNQYGAAEIVLNNLIVDAQYAESMIEVENNRQMTINAQHVVSSIIPMVLTLPVDDALDLIYAHMFQGYQHPQYDPTRTEIFERILKNPLRHHNGTPVVVGEVVAPDHINSKLVYEVFIERLTALMTEARSYTHPYRTLEDRLLSVAVWAKEIFTTAQFLSDLNTRNGKNIFLYALAKSCAEAGLPREHCPKIDLTESRWSTLSVEYTGLDGEKNTYNPFGSDYKDYLTTRFFRGIGEYSERNNNAPYFVYTGTEGANSPFFKELFSQLHGEPMELTAQEFGTGLTATPRYSDSRSTVAQSTRRTSESHAIDYIDLYKRTEFLTVAMYLEELIHGATINRILQDPSIQAEVAEIHLELERGQ